MAEGNLTVPGNCKDCRYWVLDEMSSKEQPYGRCHLMPLWCYRGEFDFCFQFRRKENPEGMRLVATLAERFDRLMGKIGRY